MQDRLEALRESLSEAGCDAFVSLAPPTNQYLAGFRGTTSGMIVTPGKALFLCDSRYTEQAGAQVKTCEVVELKGAFAAATGAKLAELRLKKVAFEPTYVTVDTLNALKKGFDGELVPVDGLVTGLRIRKSPEEVDLIRSASQLAERVLLDVIEELEPEVSERETAARIEYEFKRRGASGASFDTIGLFGAHSSLPHGEPGDQALSAGDIVLLDMGCRREGYCSDLTRTYAFGTIPGIWFEAIYNTVLEAQQRALEAVRPGISCKEVDAVARRIIGEAGYGEYFGHGLGHGVGIEIHEAPRLNPESETVLEAGMVITIEPGIYLPGQGGVRIEDLVVVTEGGCEILTSTPKNLRIIAA
ncbi:MAG: Xaa-Pro peptidase family protein [FCB group bacterium]|jgi:Xaa-Pro aminopeptidase|nr:Xaa-Pro peptidase family protein [FCB group bacterium]